MLRFFGRLPSADIAVLSVYMCDLENLRVSQDCMA